MALTAEQFVFQLSAKVSGFEDEVNTAASVFNRATAKIEAGFGRMDRRIEESTRATRVSMKALVTAAAGALGAREVMQYADAWARAKNALTSARVPAQQQAAVLERLYEQAQRYNTELNAQVDLFGNVTRAASGLTDSQEDLFRFTEAVAAGLKADGQSAAQAAGPLLQLGQALRSPIIQAEEFNSLIDGAPALLEAAANGIARYRGDVSALIRDAKSANLSSRDFFQGVIAGSEELKSRVGQSADTFEGAFQRIENALTKYIGSTDDGLSASQRLIDGLNAFADNFDNIADGALKLASIVAGALVGRAIGGLAVQIPLAIVAMRLLRVASIGAAQGASFLAANVGGATTAIAGATLASRAFRIAALGFFAGPIGLLIGGLATSMISLDGTLGRTTDSMEDLDEEMERLGLSARRTASGINSTNEALAALTAGQHARRLRQIDEELNAILAKDGTALGELFSFIGLSEGRGALEDVIDAVDTMRGRFADMRRSASDLAALDEVRRLAAALQEGEVEAQAVIDRLDEVSQTDVSSETDKLIESLEAAARRLVSLTSLQRRYNDEAVRGVAAVSDMQRLRDADAASMVNLRESTARGQAVLNERSRRAALDPTEREIEDRMRQISEEIEKAGRSAADAIEGAGAVMSQAAIRAQAESELRAERQRELIGTNSNDAISRYVSRVIAAETGGHPDPTRARNPDSTATGLGQFIESTWIDLFRRHFPDRAAGLSDAAVLAFRTNADDSKRLIEAYARENGEALQHAGQAVTEANLQLSHFLGVGDAIKVLSAAPGTPLAGLISQRSIAANPTILGGARTVEDAIGYGERRANNTRIAAGDLTPNEEATQRQIEKREELKRTIDELFASTDEQTKMILLETSLMNANASERERALTVARLEADLKRAGIPITEELRAAILRLSEARGVAAAQEEEAIISLERMQEAEGMAIEQMDRFRDSARDVLGGFVSDIQRGESAADALGNALARIADRIIESGLDSLLDSILGPRGTSFGGGGGGFLGAIGSAIGGLFGGFRERGGSVTAGRAYVVGEKRPELFVPGRSGTIVPNIPSLQAPVVHLASRGGSSRMAITIHVQGASGDQHIVDLVQQGVRAGIGQYDKTLDRTIGTKIAGARGMNRAGF